MKINSRKRSNVVTNRQHANSLRKRRWLCKGRYRRKRRNHWIWTAQFAWNRSTSPIWGCCNAGTASIGTVFANRSKSISMQESSPLNVRMLSAALSALAQMSSNSCPTTTSRSMKTIRSKGTWICTTKTCTCLLLYRSWCPSAGCKYVFYFNEADTEFACPLCSKVYCLKCKV